MEPEAIADHGWKLLDQYPAVGLLLLGVGVTWWLLRGRTNGKGEKGEHGDIGATGLTGPAGGNGPHQYATAVAIEALGNQIKAAVATLADKIDAVMEEQKAHDGRDQVAFANVDGEFGRVHKTETLIFEKLDAQNEKLGIHGEALATIKAHREQWEPGKPERRARG